MEEALKRILNGNVTDVSACETSTRPTSAVQSAFEQPKNFKQINFETIKTPNITLLIYIFFSVLVSIRERTQATYY